MEKAGDWGQAFEGTLASGPFPRTSLSLSPGKELSALYIPAIMMFNLTKLSGVSKLPTKPSEPVSGHKLFFLLNCQ